MAKTQKNYYKISRVQFIGILLTAIVGSAITTAIATINTLNTDHFTIITNATDIARIEEQIVPRNEIDIHLKNIYDELESINGKLDKIIRE